VVGFYTGANAMTDSTEEQILTTNFKHVIPFHGMLLTVVEHNGVDYIPLRPIVDLLGTQWKTARNKAFFGDNIELYGTKELLEPIFNSFDTPRGAKKAVFILLEAGETYLMKTNTNQVRTHGDSSTADYLLKLQKEWRKVLHEYENNGVVSKQKSFDTKKSLKELLQARKLAQTAAEKKAMTQLISAEFAELGYPLVEPQGELPI
jgi:hypothetical protein